jgi:hypothetical protein
LGVYVSLSLLTSAEFTKALRILSRRTVLLPPYILKCKTNVEDIEKGMVECFEICSDH